MTRQNRLTAVGGALMLLTGLAACHEGNSTPNINPGDAGNDTLLLDTGGDGGGLDSTGTDGGPDGAVDATKETTPDVQPDTPPPSCENGCDDGNPCTVGACDQANGVCTFTDAPNGTSCGTCGGFCLDGGCAFSDVPLPTGIVAFQCQGDAQCDDNDPCTTDTCDPLSCGCSNDPIPGCGACGPTGCDDGNPCTTDTCGAAGCEYAPLDDGSACGVCGATCQAGECTVSVTTADKAAPFEPPCASDSDCAVDDPCTVGTCSAESCTCVYVTPPDCGGCPGGCDDGNNCTVDSCVDGKCSNLPIPGCGGCGDGCNDDNPCTQDICSADGQCQYIAIEPCGGCDSDADCDDNDACTADACDAATGQCSYVVKDDCVPCSVSCDDGNPCTTDTCGANGECQNSPIPGCGDLCQELCNDDNPCTNDSCDPATGQCNYTIIPNCNPGCTNNCDDGNPCTVDTCDADTGECQNLPIPGCNPGCQDQCNDGNVCTIDKCNADGTCVYEPNQDGASCGVCGAVCQQGQCVGPPVAPVCSTDSDCVQDDDPCTKSVCVDQCSCEVQQVPNCGVNCDSDDDCEDQDPCTLNSCDAAAGVCAPPVPNPDCPGDCSATDSCDDGDDCTFDFCDPSGKCQNLPFPGGPGCGTPPCNTNSECFDGDSCTNDLCIAGECQNPPIDGCQGFCQQDSDCNDNDDCTSDFCLDNGSCAYLTVPNCNGGCTSALDCFDGDTCTIDSCVAGKCQYTPNPGCNPQTPSCSSQGVVDTFTAQTSIGQTVKVAGVPVSWGIQSCTEMACAADNPCCNMCTGSLAIQDSAGAIQSYDPTDLGAPWSAQSDDCGQLLATQPPQMDSAYWVWGTVGVGGAFTPPMPNAIAIALGQLEVGGWCIQTNPQGLPGTYKGTFSSANGLAYAVTLTIAYTGSGWLFEMTDDSGAVTFTITGVQAGDGSVSFTLEAQYGSASEVSPVTLFSNHNTLSGEIGGFSSDAAFPVPPPQPQGQLSVTRQP